MTKTYENKIEELTEEQIKELIEKIKEVLKMKGVNVDSDTDNKVEIHHEINLDPL